MDTLSRFLGPATVEGRYKRPGEAWSRWVGYYYSGKDDDTFDPHAIFEREANLGQPINHITIVYEAGQKAQFRPKKVSDAAFATRKVPF